MWIVIDSFCLIITIRINAITSSSIYPDLLLVIQGIAAITTFFTFCLLC